MEIKTTTQLLKMLKQSFGKRLMLKVKKLSIVIVLALFGFNASAQTITSPLAGDTIYNRCDLQFCLNDSLGLVTNYNFALITTDVNGTNIYVSSDQNSNYGMGSDFCLHTYDMPPTIAIGQQTFYLRVASMLYDTVTVFIANPISPLNTNLTYSEAAGPGGDYTFSVSGLNPSETYTLDLLSTTTMPYPTIASTAVTNASSGSITINYPHNGQFTRMLRVTACDGEFIDYDAIVTVTNSTCNSYTEIVDSMFQSPWNHCFNGSTSVYGFISYANLSANGSSSVFVNWGDGTNDTLSIPHNGNTDSAWIQINIPHVYTNPGVYSPMMIFYDAGACYNDTLIGNIDISSPVCGNLSGVVYSDVNNNCSQDIGETGVAGIAVSVTLGGNTYWAWTNASGYYGFYSLPTGSYTIQIGNLNSGYAVTCSNSLPHTTNVTSGTTVENFALSCAGFDVAVTGISLMDGFFPGLPDAILPHVGILNSACNATMQGQVKIILDPCITYITSGYNFNNPPALVIPASTGDTLIWNVSDINNIGNFNYWDYAINTSTCTSAQVGDTACITIMVLPTAGDADLSNNTYTHCFEIGVSYDPNNKEVLPQGTGVEGFIPSATPILTYTLNFQNTGTAVARNIYLLDTIDANLNINSIEILSASHKMQVYLLPSRTVKFMFADIMLADSTSDELNSHGYVTFRIKLNTGLTPGTELENTGHIYFDYNEAVVTNTVLNTIETPAGIGQINMQGLLKVYPNPAKDKLIVRVNKNGNSTIDITDLLGKAVKQITTGELQTEINVSDLQAGIYFIKLTQDNVSYVEKIVISK